MKILSTISIVICCLLGVGAVRPGTTSNQLAEDDALKLVRELNTAEATLFLAKNGNHAYASLATSVNSPFAKKFIAVPVDVTDETSGSAGNYALSLMASRDGKHYLLALTPAECGPAFFSTEAAVIYPAKALGCP